MAMAAAKSPTSDSANKKLLRDSFTRQVCVTNEFWTGTLSPSPVLHKGPQDLRETSSRKRSFVKEVFQFESRFNVSVVYFTLVQFVALFDFWIDTKHIIVGVLVLSVSMFRCVIEIRMTFCLNSILLYNQTGVISMNE